MEQALSGGGLRIVFVRRGDRFGHTIESVVDGQPRVVFASVEGDAAEPWPASPPFQQLHFEDRPEGKRVALLVGMAGTSHWSASVEFDATRGEAIFDVACRMRSAPVQLGSLYAGHEPYDWIHPLEGVQARTADGVSVGPISQPVEIPCTLRWKYVVRPPAGRP